MMTMTMSTNAGQIGQKLETIFTNIPRGSQKALVSSVRKGVAEAKANAPHFTGNLERGIIGIINVGKGQILSAVPKFFPYHLWVNEQPDYLTIMNRRLGRMVSYAEVARTGTPGYFTLMVAGIGNTYALEVSKEIDNAIRR